VNALVVHGTGEPMQPGTGILSTRIKQVHTSSSVHTGHEHLITLDSSLARHGSILTRHVAFAFHEVPEDLDTMTGVDDGRDTIDTEAILQHPQDVLYLLINASIQLNLSHTIESSLHRLEDRLLLLRCETLNAGVSEVVLQLDDGGTETCIQGIRDQHVCEVGISEQDRHTVEVRALVRGAPQLVPTKALIGVPLAKALGLCDACRFLVLLRGWGWQDRRSMVIIR